VRREDQAPPLEVDEHRPLRLPARDDRLDGDARQRRDRGQFLLHARGVGQVGDDEARQAREGDHRLGGVAVRRAVERERDREVAETAEFGVQRLEHRLPRLREAAQ